MFSSMLFLFFACTIFVSSESAFVDTIKPCRVNDKACHKEIYQSVIRDAAKTGIAEFGISALDPVHLKNVSISLFDVDIHIIDGTVKGIKGCVVNEFSVNLEKKTAVTDVTCDLLIKGHYKVHSEAPFIKELLGGSSVDGDGVGKMKIEKLHVVVEYDISVKKHDDGEIYVKAKKSKTDYKYDIGRMVFNADKLLVGETDATNRILSFLNENWRIVIQVAGKNFMDKAMEHFYSLAFKFFDTVPAKYYVIEDLTPYLKN